MDALQMLLFRFFLIFCHYSNVKCPFCPLPLPLPSLFSLLPGGETRWVTMELRANGSAKLGSGP